MLASLSCYQAVFSTGIELIFDLIIGDEHQYLDRTFDTQSREKQSASRAYYLKTKRNYPTSLGEGKNGGIYTIIHVHLIQLKGLATNYFWDFGFVFVSTWYIYRHILRVFPTTTFYRLNFKFAYFTFLCSFMTLVFCRNSIIVSHQ